MLPSTASTPVHASSAQSFQGISSPPSCPRLVEFLDKVFSLTSRLSGGGDAVARGFTDEELVSYCLGAAVFYLVFLQAVCYSPLGHAQANATLLYDKGLYPKLEQLPAGGWCACPDLDCWLLAKCVGLGAATPRLKVTDVVGPVVDQVLQL